MPAVADDDRIEIELRVTRGGQTVVLRGVGEAATFDTKHRYRDDGVVRDDAGRVNEIRTSSITDRVTFSWRPVPDPNTGVIYTEEVLP
jgi:hypothetical protein